MSVTIDVAEAKASLYVKIKMDKDSYVVGDPMNFIIKIYNDGDTPINDVRVYSTIYGSLNATGNFKYKLGTMNPRDIKEISISEVSSEPGHFRNKVVVYGMEDESIGGYVISGSIKPRQSKQDASIGIVISYIGLLGIIGLLSRKI